MPEDAPVDLPTLLKRVERVEAELAAAKAELARKDQIIAALQQRAVLVDGGCARLPTRVTARPAAPAARHRLRPKD